MIRSAYEQMIHAKVQFRRVGVVLLAAGAVAGCLTPWVPDIKYPVFTFLVLGLYSTGLADFQSRLAHIQAALDVKRAILAPTSAIKTVSLAAGDTLWVDAACQIKVSTACKVEISA